MSWVSHIYLYVYINSKLSIGIMLKVVIIHLFFSGKRKIAFQKKADVGLMFLFRVSMNVASVTPTSNSF